MASAKFFITIFIATNLFISGCHGGLLGFLGGMAFCQGACYSGYLACIGVAAGGAAATAGAALPALPAVVAACTAGETACIASCVAAFTVGTGPV